MLPGFLPFSRATFMLDVVSVAMAVILPVLAWSVFLVKAKRAYGLHKVVQVTLGIVLLVAVLLFEIDIRLYGWRHLATPSPYYETVLFPVLYVHLAFSCSTTVLWIATILHGLLRFPIPPRPSSASGIHKPLAWASTVFMFVTAITGWTFYWMAFVAT